MATLFTREIDDHHDNAGKRSLRGTGIFSLDISIIVG
jgi:hypothetical protein